MTLIKIYRVKSVLIFKMRCIYIKFHNTVLSVWVTGFVGIYKNHRIISYRNIVYVPVCLKQNLSLRDTAIFTKNRRNTTNGRLLTLMSKVPI